MARILAATGLCLLLIAPRAAAQAAFGTDADRAAIRAHIESIFQAFIDNDIPALFATHAEDWRGFLEGSRTPIKGIDEYMRANGIPWPQPAGAKPAPPRPAPAPGAPVAGYRVHDYDIRFESPDMAIVNFIGDFTRSANGEITVTNRYRIMDIYGKRNGAWIQVASHTVVDPQWRAETLSRPMNVPAPIRDQILKAREAVWRAIFANDRAAMEKLIPNELITIESGPDWGNRDAVFAEAERMAARGTKLTRLEFPKTEMQVYGNGMFAVIYTTYEYDLETAGGKTTASGRATEMFVRKPGGWANVGWHLAR
ncbi:MAG TPA: nuclear transport factor 2 family protein [Vicinamibacterales bacterium]|nr:nuclear transport factor 2 family protein [Vicinamibacterales bacterium]